MTDILTRAQSQAMSAAIFNEDEPLLNIGGSDQVDYIIKRLFEIVRQDKFDYDKEDADIQKMFINERNRVRSLMVKTYNLLERFHQNIDPSTVEKGGSRSFAGYKL